MKILFFGDVVGQSGVEAVKQTLPKWSKAYQPDLIIANAENSDPIAARGSTRQTMSQLAEAGVEAFTLGDHLKDMSAEDFAPYPTVRPANLRGVFPGEGHKVIESVAGQRLLLFSLLGNAFIKLPINNYFKAADAILAQYSAEPLDAILLDFHAEATSEKNALGHYLDGLVSAVLGTHTHVPTADTRLLPKGTAYQSDVGMCGGYDSAIGFDVENATRWLHRELGEPFPSEAPKPASGKPFICDAVLIETGGRDKAGSLKRLSSRPSAKNA